MKIVKRNLSEFLEKEMDRREFLKHIGIIVLSVIGVGKLVDLLRTQGTTAQPQQVSVASSPAVAPNKIAPGKISSITYVPSTSGGSAKGSLKYS